MKDSKKAVFIKKTFSEINLAPVRMKAIKFGGLLFVSFLGLLFLETTAFFKVMDPAITILLQRIFPRNFDQILSVFSLLGSFEITAVILLIIAAGYFLKKGRILYSLAFFGIILVFEYIGKVFLFHPNPPAEFFRYTLPFSFPTSYVQTGFSFPSGHVSRTIFLFVVASFLTIKNVKHFPVTLIVSYIILLLVMVFSRIYLGEHWFSDTLGGLLLGGSMGLFAIGYFKNE